MTTGRDALREEYKRWMEDQCLNIGSAREAFCETFDLNGRLITEAHKRWLLDFIHRWEEMTIAERP